MANAGPSLVNNNESTRPGPAVDPDRWTRATAGRPDNAVRHRRPSQQKGRPRAAMQSAFMCDVRDRTCATEWRRHANVRRFVPGAIPTVDFLLYDFGRAGKLSAVKSHVGEAITPRSHRR